MYRKHLPALVLLLTVLFSSAPYASPQVLFEGPPSWVDEQQFDRSSNASSGGTAYHLLDVQVNHALEQLQYYNHLVMEPLNSQGIDQVSELQFRFIPDYQDLIIHHVHIIRDGKIIDKRDRNNLKVFQREDEIGRKLYTEKWDALLILEDVRPRDLISYSYSIRGSNPVLGRHDYGEITLNWGVSIGRVKVDVIADSRLSYRFVNGEHPLRVSRQGKLYKHSIDIRNTPAAPNEGEFPAWYQPTNSFQYSGIRAWSEVVDWAQGLYQLDMSLPEELAAMVDGWARTLSKEEAVNEILQFVQDDIRYFGVEIGVNSHLPRTPQEIMARRYGDCKDKTVLAMAMLHRIGVTAYPALVSSTRGPVLTQDLPSPFSFDHVITYFELAGKQYWIDVTASSQGKRIQDKGFFDYKNALLVKKGVKQLSQMTPPYTGAEVTRLRSELNYQIDAASEGATLKVDTHYQGLRAEDMRRYIDALPRDTISANLLNFYSRNYPTIREQDPLQMVDSRNDNTLRISEAYTIDSLARMAAARKIFTVHTAAIPSFLYFPESTGRKTPLAIAHPVNISEVVNVEIKGDVLWNEDLDPVSLRNPWFEFDRRVSRDRNSFNITYSFRSLKDHVPPQDMPQYMEQLRAVDGKLAYQFWAKGQNQESGAVKTEMRGLMDSLIRKRQGE